MKSFNPTERKVPIKIRIAQRPQRNILQLVYIAVFTLGLVNSSKAFSQASISQLPWKYVATQMPDEWYGSPESVRVAGNVLLYQRDIGGWPKNLPLHKVLSEPEKATINDEKGLNDAILDNDATTTEMKFMAKMFAKTGTPAYKDSFEKGLKFILDAQYENGGWPMFYPLRKGYYTHITFNDNATYNILELLKAIFSKQPLFSGVVTEKDIKDSRKAYDKGIDCILKTQIIVKGKPTIWCAQHDENTLLPAKARSYELPSFSGAESCGLIKVLMEIQNPPKEVVRAVNGAVEWLDSHRVKHCRVESFTNADGKRDRRFIEDPSSGDLWARFYDLDTELPFFCDRDGIKKSSLAEIGYERRTGYNWYTEAPKEILNMYPDWKAKYVK
jgi:PelA/Pel-15E family pectate lyase